MSEKSEKSSETKGTKLSDIMGPIRLNPQAKAPRPFAGSFFRGDNPKDKKGKDKKKDADE